MATTTDTTVTITPEAQATINRMKAHVWELREFYGEDSDEFQRAAETLGDALHAVLSLGGRVMSDGPVSLYGIGAFHYGVIFRAAPVTLNTKVIGATHMEGEYGESVPVPGAWSVHS